MPTTIGIDHIYLTVSDLTRSQEFYDQVLVGLLGFRSGGRFHIGDDEHQSYYNRHFGIVLRPARTQIQHDPYAPGLHHLCLRVDTIDEVHALADGLEKAGLAFTPPARYPEYADDYHACFFTDPDGLRLEVTNYRQDRRDRHDHWHSHD